MKKRKITNQLTSIILASSLLLAASCAVYEDDDDDSSSSNQQEEQDQNDEGEYRCEVEPVNEVIVNNVTTVNNIQIVAEEVNFNITVNGVPPLTRHRQCIHRGNRCPTNRDDRNRDGLIDGPEAFAASGGILLPLDGDVNTQSGGEDQLPRAGVDGEYTYTQDASFSTMMADLRSPDTNTEDEYVKLNPDESLNLEQRVFIIYGVPDGSSLPDTVGAFPGKTPEESFPIACGPLSQFSTPTGGQSGGTAGGISGGTSGGATSGGGQSSSGTSGGGESSSGSSGGSQTSAGTSGGGASSSGSPGGTSSSGTSGGGESSSGSAGGGETSSGTSGGLS